MWEVPKPYDGFTKRKFILELGPEFKVKGPIHIGVTETYTADFDGGKSFGPKLLLSLR